VPADHIKAGQGGCDGRQLTSALSVEVTGTAERGLAGWLESETVFKLRRVQSLGTLLIVTESALDFRRP
jgi:hypothetical protein